MTCHSYRVHAYPTLHGRDDRELVPTPLHREAACVKCAGGLTIVGYLDRRTWRVWPTCWDCARSVERDAAEAGEEFVPYRD